MDNSIMDDSIIDDWIVDDFLMVTRAVKATKKRRIRSRNPAGNKTWKRRKNTKASC
mgnify:CR=1 FL=1